jgi:hypothetical protein
VMGDRQAIVGYLSPVHEATNDVLELGPGRTGTNSNAPSPPRKQSSQGGTGDSR